MMESGVCELAKGNEVYNTAAINPPFTKVLCSVFVETGLERCLFNCMIVLDLHDICGAV